MKILYAIQGTGNGHVSRANEIIPFLIGKCELDIMLSGTQADVGLDYPIKFFSQGLGFIFGKKGGVDLYKTFKQLQSKRFLKEVKTLPVEDYDLVINDFEPISAWACKLKNIPCFGLSHQFAVSHKDAPRPTSSDILAAMILKYYAPCTSGVGFHFKRYGDNIFTPVIKKEIRNAIITNLGHYTVYLPSYEDKKLIEFFGAFKNTNWQIFSKHTKKSYSAGNCKIRPVDTEAFTKSFTSCAGIICGAGFETPAEALQMGKKLLIIPMKNQYEQHCNAAAAQELGVATIKSLKKKHAHKVESWLNEKEALHIDFPDETAKIIDYILSLATIKNIAPVAAKELPLNNIFLANWVS